MVLSDIIYPILPLRDIVIFPHMIAPLFVGRKQIGMAVPVLGAKIILESVLKTFANIKYPYVEANFDYQ